MQCAVTQDLMWHEAKEEKRQAAYEAHLSRVIGDAQIDVDAFAESVSDFLPPGFSTRADVRNESKTWATQAKRDATIDCVRAMQSIFVAACKGEPQTIAEKAIGAMLVKIVTECADDSFWFDE